MNWDHHSAPPKPGPNHWRVRTRFAFLPTRIGQHVVWLERYTWRYLRPEENGYIAARNRPGKPAPPPMDENGIEYWREYRTAAGTLAWRLTIDFRGPYPAQHLWRAPQAVAR